jgi:glycosyltransferase involved in cell wall biosynthesis
MPPEVEIMTARPVRIAHILWSGFLGGAERHVVDLTAGVPSTDIESCVVFLNKAESLSAILKKEGISFFEAGMKNGFSFSGVNRLTVFLCRGNFDIIHEHIGTKWSRLFFGLFFPKACLFYTIHNSRFPQTFIWWQMLWEKASRLKVRRYIAVSDAIKNAYIEYLKIPKNKIVTIPNFVDTSRFDCVSEDDRITIRKSLGLSTHDIMLLSIGRLVEQKAFDRLIALCLPVIRENVHVRLFIVGRGPMEKNLQEIIIKNNIGSRVTLLGERPDVACLLKACDIFVFAPRYESFGIVIAEAMAAGKPVVTVKIPAIDEIITNDEDGIMVEPPVNNFIDKQDNAFASAVRRLINNPDIREKMGALAIKKIRSVFSKDVVTKKIVSEYLNVLHLKTTLPR